MKQIFSFFKIWIVVLLFLAAVTGFAGAKHYIDTNVVRSNTATPGQRVYDYAKVMSKDEERRLEELIAKREQETACDFVVVTINEPVVLQSANTRVSDYEWELAMRNYADDFYDNNQFGYNTTGGDGSLLLYNFYEDQKGAWFSTGGKVYVHFSEADIEKVLDAFYGKIKESPYLAFRAYVDSVYREMTGRNNWFMKVLVAVVPLVGSLFFVGMNIRPKAGEKTVDSRTYVNGGKAKMKEQRDTYIRKTISQRKIETSSSGGYGGGRGGGHRSSGGFSHGGGGRRG